MFPSLPASILYGIIMLLLPTCISNFAVNIDLLLFRHTELILTILRSSSVHSCYTSCSISLTTLFFLLWQTFQKCPILLHLVHALPYAGHCLGWWIPPLYLQGCHGVVWCTDILSLSSFTLLDIFILSNFLDSVCILTLPLWPSVPLPSWPMLIHLHLLCGHHF